MRVSPEDSLAHTGLEALPTRRRSVHSAAWRDLERLFPGRRFTLDGHLVGSIGEVLAAHRYGLSLLPASTQGHDAKAENGVLVQVKATQRDQVGISSQPQNLIVLKLLADGAVEEVFNGPGEIAWHHAGPVQKTGQRPISVSKLKKLMGSVSADRRLPEKAN